MTKAQQIRILVVDDHTLIRDGLASLIALEQDMTLVGEAGTGEEAIQLFRKERPDVTLMDIRLPGISGIEALAAIRNNFPQARVIMLTNYEGDEDIHRALNAGASGYLLKDTARAEIAQTIRSVHTGRRVIPPATAARLTEHMPRIDLTARELEVLELIVKGKSNKEIGDQLSITEATVKVHVIHILSKLDVDDRTQAAVAALQRGIVHL